MSIASEITRLQNAKSALKTAINAKGGTLTTETLDQYASAVDNISVAKPTLNAPTISITDNVLTITPNTNNGNFVTGYKVYSDGSLIATIQTTTLDLSTYLTEEGTYAITVKAYGTYFNDSVASNSENYVIASGYTVTIDIETNPVGSGGNIADYYADMLALEYSLDNGSSWVDITQHSNNFTINDVTQIKFHASIFSPNRIYIGAIPPNYNEVMDTDDDATSSNLSVTANITYYISYYDD